MGVQQLAALQSDTSELDYSLGERPVAEGGLPAAGGGAELSHLESLLYRLTDAVPALGSPEVLRLPSHCPGNSLYVVVIASETKASFQRPAIGKESNSWEAHSLSAVCFRTNGFGLLCWCLGTF